MHDLKTQNYFPSEALSRVVDSYWSCQNLTSQAINIPIVPDGCMDIIYKTEAGRREILLVGAMDKTIIVSMASGDYYFGIRFKPSYLSFFFTTSMQEFSNKIVPLRSLSEEFYLKLNFWYDCEARVVQKLNTVFEKEFLSSRVEKRVLVCVDETLKRYGNISTQELIVLSGISQRQLERLFSYHLGYSVKKFICIVRFYNAHKTVVACGVEGLSEVAYEFGYCDQSHFNKEHKKFTSFSPSDENMSILYNTNK